MNTTNTGLRLLHDLRRSLLELPTQLKPRTVTTGQPEGCPGTVRATA